MPHHLTLTLTLNLTLCGGRGGQMPHHHDWHHEGHKGCNYSFSPMGGLWDCVFSTRKNGRALERFPEQATAHDVRRGKAGDKPRGKNVMDQFPLVVMPIFFVLFLAAVKLYKTGGNIAMV